MRTALGIDLRTGRCVRAWEDGRTEPTAPEGVTEKPDAVAVAPGEGLDAATWRNWASERFGLDVLEVAEDVAREHAPDVAAGAALWALTQRKRAAVVVPPVGAPLPTGQQPPSESTLGDFGEGQSMSDFGDGQTMSDFAEPSRMSDFGDGQSMSDFGDGQSMSDFGGSPEPPVETTPSAPPKPVRKVQIAVGAAVAVAVIAVAAVVFASTGSDPAPEVPVAASAPTTDPERTTTSTAVPAERSFDVNFTITSTNADQFPDAQLRTGLTGAGILKLSCEGETCLFELKPTDGTALGIVIAGSTLEGASLEGLAQSNEEPQGPGDCPRQHTHTVKATVGDGSISGEAAFTADPIVCPGPQRNTIHVYTLTFQGTEAATSAPSVGETSPGGS